MIIRIFFINIISPGTNISAGFGRRPRLTGAFAAYLDGKNSDMCHLFSGYLTLTCDVLPGRVQSHNSFKASFHEITDSAAYTDRYLVKKNAWIPIFYF